MLPSITQSKLIKGTKNNFDSGGFNAKPATAHLSKICRSATSLLMSNELGKHSNVNRDFRGIAKEKPKRARYSDTWDPRKLLEQINICYSNRIIITIVNAELFNLMNFASQ